MKYRVIKNDKDKTIDVFTEDGGFVEIYHNETGYISNMHSMRLTDVDKSDYPKLWEKLSEGNNLVKEWGENDTEDDMIEHALHWLVMPTPDKWEKDEKLFDNILKKAYKL
jgi:hypothetical protein